MCAKCDNYADQREAATEEDAAPEPVYHGYEQSSRNSVRCEGCGERVEYLDIVRYIDELDQWWHQGCEEEKNAGHQ